MERDGRRELERRGWRYLEIDGWREFEDTNSNVYLPRCPF
jgi:hypothetical protein